ncbi:hypothetical protein LXL04_028903 [Taraxacum kok-saghyz]
MDLLLRLKKIEIRLGRKRHVVDEKYTRPQGLSQHKDVDHKKLRKLILDSKLAPCYLGDDDCICDLKECPICFLACAIDLHGFNMHLFHFLNHFSVLSCGV